MSSLRPASLLAPRADAPSRGVPRGRVKAIRSAKSWAKRSTSRSNGCEECLGIAHLCRTEMICATRGSVPCLSSIIRSFFSNSAAREGSLYCEDILRSLRSGLTPRPANTEGRAFAVLRPHLDRPAVRDHDLLRDEQPKTEPGCALRRGGSPAESIEDVREQHLRNGGSLIVDLHPDLSVGAAQGDGDRRPRLAMHDRVRHQVRDHLAGAVRIEPAVGPPLGRAAQLYARMEYLQVVENLVTEREQITLTGRDG